MILRVSFQIVIRVVEHGKCISVNIIMHTAVFIVQPFSVRVPKILCISPVSDIPVAHLYIIRIIGITISFAGNPSRKPERITPSSPIILPRGSRKTER